MYIYVEDLTRVAFLELLGGIVVLGKFDALHIGHRELAIQASRGRASPPFLLSFVGMAKVLGWKPRYDLVFVCIEPAMHS
ncbi:hypothetical protein AAHE18_14G106600 [Arachis hypogaea]